MRQFYFVILKSTLLITLILNGLPGKYQVALFWQTFQNEICHSVLWLLRQGIFGEYEKGVKDWLPKREKLERDCYHKSTDVYFFVLKSEDV